MSDSAAELLNHARHGRKVVFRPDHQPDYCCGVAESPLRKEGRNRWLLCLNCRREKARGCERDGARSHDSAAC